MGLFSYLLVLGCWESERCIEWYLLVHRSAIHLEILFERILKTWQSSQDNSLEALILYFLTRAVSAFDPSYYYKPLWTSRQDKNGAYLHYKYCKVKERIHGETSHAISIKRCKCMGGWMNGWIQITPWGYGFFLSNNPYLFLDMVTPFLSLFFGSCFFGMPSFLFLGQP